MKQEKSFLSRCFASIIATVFYPIVIPARVLAGNESFLKKFISVLFSVFILFPVWVVEMVVILFIGWVGLQVLGITYIKVPVAGASMLPTLPTSGYVKFKRYIPVQYLEPKIHRGDLVVFENETTKKELEKENKNASGFVKRVIGVAGDKILIKDGYVYVNNKVIREPYILKPRSTFGGDKISDCEEITVPPEDIFVLGDNRKASMDSRHIGFVSLNSIEFYRAYDEQKEFASKWRDTSTENTDDHSSIFNVDQYVSLLNKERQKNGLTALRHDPRLDTSAKKRAEAMLTYDDMSFEATRSGYTMQKALRDAGYSNTVYGEFPIMGYYDTDELLQSFFERPSSRDFLLEKDYDDIGISTFVGELHNCPVQIVVQHFAGYQPPDYSVDEIDSWRRHVASLKEVQPSWQRLKESENFYNENKNDVDRMNEIIALRISHSEQIVSRMEKNQWLTEEEKKYMDEDTRLGEEQDTLAKKLNEAVKK